MNAELAATLVDALERADTALVVVCPGSRSTPLVLALQRSPLHCTVAHDERSAAFIALGAARASERPAAVLTTSGTAVGNLYPAVLEAEAEALPLVALTADRPRHLVGTGANQTFDQHAVFGGHVAHAFDLDRIDRPLRARLDEALAAGRGPVHINARFEKPLEAPAAAPVPRGATIGASRAVPDLDKAAAMLASARRGLLVVGRLIRRADQDAARAVAEKLGWPTVTSALSGLRLVPLDAPVLDDVEGALGSSAFAQALAPDLVLHLGGPPVSARLGPHLRGVPTLRVGGPDPATNPGHRVDGSVAAFAAALPEAGPSELAGLAQQLSTICPDAPLSPEAQIAREGVRAATGALFVGNSSPIRDVDRFAPRHPDAPRLFCNRGLSGIDGGLSTAAGLAQVLGHCHVLLGDVAFLHDAGAMSALSGAPLDITVIDNRGGALFDRLPIAGHAPPAVFDRFFTTPHNVDLEALAAAYGFSIRVVASDRGTERDARRAYDRALTAALDKSLRDHRRVA